MTLPKIDPIDFLGHRKFPHPHQRYGYRTGYVRGVPFSSRALPGDKDEWSKEREQYRIELGLMPPEELQALVDLENEKVNSVLPLVADRLCYARTPSGEWKIALLDQAS